MPNARLVSLDLGNGFVKFRSSTRAGSFPSVYAMEEPGLDFEGLAGVDDFVIDFEGRRYAVGYSAARLGSISVRTLDRTRITGPEYRVLFAAALASAAGQGRLIAPVMSLPVIWYDRREQVRDRLAGEYEVWRKGWRDDEGEHPDRWLNFTVPHELMRIVPEGFGSICSLALDEWGRPVNNGLLKIRVGVVDMGTKTLDLTMFDGLQLVPRKSDGYDEGVGLVDIYHIMGRLAQRELGHSFSFEELDAAMYGNPIYVGAHDVSDRVDEWKHEALEQVANAIAGRIKSKWQGGGDVQRLLLTGGGAQHVYPYLAMHFDHLEPVPDGAMANCDGAYLYGLLREANA